jgi:hypothetical protein
MPSPAWGPKGISIDGFPKILEEKSVWDLHDFWGNMMKHFDVQNVMPCVSLAFEVDES